MGFRTCSKLARSKPGEIQQALGRAVIDCVDDEPSWRLFADELRKQASGGPWKKDSSGRPRPDDTKLLVEFVTALAKSRRPPEKTSTKGLDRVLDLLTDGCLKHDLKVNTWRPGPKPTEARFKQEALEPFVCRHREKLTDLHVVAPPWAKRGKPPILCASHGGRRELNCRDCWKESKCWASVYVFGKQHNFDMAARSSELRDNKAPRSETRTTDILVVEVKVVKRPFTRPDPRFIGQLLLARSRHDRVAGICAMLPMASGQTSLDGAEILGRISDRIGVQFAALDLRACS